jgi:hypothetical protein
VEDRWLDRCCGLVDQLVAALHASGTWNPQLANKHTPDWFVCKGKDIAEYDIF